MNFNKINADQICSVRTYLNLKCNDFIYKKSKKYFSFLFPKEGFYYKWVIGSPVLMSKQEIESKWSLVCKENEVYYLPHIEMKLSNGQTHKKYFRTEEDLKEYYDTFLAPLNLIDA